MKNVYLWMTLGLMLTAVVAYFVGTSPAMVSRIYSRGFLIFLVIAQLAVVMFLSSRLDRMTTTAAIGAFILYSVLTGFMLSSVVLAFSQVLISYAFFTTALTFGSMSIFAMTTRRNLGTWARALSMGLIGLLVSSVIAVAFKLDTFYFLISIVGVLVFCGLTAWDTQKIMALNASYGDDIDQETYVKLSIICALELYLDFINIFLYLLRIFSNSRRN